MERWSYYTSERCALYLDHGVALVLLLCLMRNFSVHAQETTTAAVSEVDCESAIGCECMDLLVITGVVCDNVTDFQKLTGRLGDGSLYPVNETYEITITGTRTIPPRAIEGLIVYRLYIDDAITSDVSYRVFEGVLRLKRLHVRISAMTSIPDLKVVSHSLWRLNFDRSKLTSLGSEIQNLPVLVEATFRHNSIRNVSGDAFLGTESILTLDMSDNLIEFLPHSLLDSLTSLSSLALTHNRLQTVHGLLRVARPMFIYMSDNNLTDADDIFYPDTNSVVSVALDGNPLGGITENSFTKKIPHVRFIFLDRCQISEFNVSHFHNLSRLALLSMRGNLLETIPPQTIDIGSNLQLLLEENQISSFEAEITFNVKRLLLSDNEMRRLDSALQLTQLQEVEIKRNRLEVLLESDLRGVHGTENLVFRENVIKRIDEGTFVSIRNDLQNLDLSMNRIGSLNGSVRYLSRLKSLNISHNHITSFKSREFVGLNELAELYMQKNKIISLSGQLQQIPQLQYLVVEDNRLYTMHLSQLPRSLRFLQYKNNPIVCDCSLMPFLEWLYKSSHPETDVKYCHSSNSTSDVVVMASLDDNNEQENSTFPYYYFPCPRSCGCSCTRDVNGSYIEVDCSSRNSSTPPQAFQAITRRKSLKMQQNEESQFAVADRVLSLNLEHNYISSLAEWTFPFDLKKLRLANNELQVIPESVKRLSRLRTLTLSGNPWMCDCKAVDFKTMIISKYEGVLDANNTRCGPSEERKDLTGKVLSSLSDVDLCPSDVGFYVTITMCLLTLMLIVAGMKIVYNRYELNIKVWLYAHGVSWVKEKELDKDKPFDAFISFSHQDEDFVNNSIVDEIEEYIPDIRLCIHNRHFLPGEFIHVNIMNAVLSSKRTVIVLSRNFLESEWCLLEFRAAHLQALEDRVHRIIVIKVGELPEDIDPAIKVYLDSTTYVTWGEKYFWQKLFYALPRPDKQFYGSTTTTVM